IEGDLQRKDYFLRDDIGDRTLFGIQIFKAATGLAVHSRMRTDEVEWDPIGGTGERLVNGNHAQGPHIVDQHGVILISHEAFPYPGGYGGSSKPGTPKSGVAIGFPLNWPSTRDDIESGTLDLYDMTVAHELSHMANVWHHGDIDHKDGALLTIVFPGRNDTP